MLMVICTTIDRYIDSVYTSPAGTIYTNSKYIFKLALALISMYIIEY
jgi:hypothetical protein